LPANEIHHLGKHARPTAKDLFTVISVEDTLFLFKAISSPISNRDPKSVMSFNIRELSGYKRYQDSLLALIKHNLVERENGTAYRVTKLGKAVYVALSLIEDALNMKDRLEIIDSLDAHRETPPSERNTIIERLIDNKEIQRILIKKDF
jgi:hypothetical protein